MDILCVDEERQHKSDRAKQDHVSVFKARGVVFRVYIGREVVQLDESNKCRRENYENAEYYVNLFRTLVHIAEERIYDENQDSSDDDRDADIQRSMNSDVHTGKCRERNEKNKNDPQRGVFKKPRRCAENGKGILRVAAGEGVAGCLGACAFDYREVRILDPGARNAKPQLQKLVDDRSGKAHGHHVIAAAFVQTPKNDDGGHDKHSLASEICHKPHELVEKRSTYAFKCVEQFHVSPQYYR